LALKNAENKNIIVFGASIAGKQVYQWLKKQNIKISYYCDNNPEKIGTYYNDVNVISLSMLSEKILGGGYLVIIASCFFEIIYEQIRHIEPQCPIYVFTLYDPLDVKNTDTLFSISEMSRLKKLYSHDAYSSQLIDLVCNRGFTCRYDVASVRELAGYGGIDEYFYDDIVNKIIAQELTYIDVGTWNGDSVIQVHNRFGDKIKKIYCFEPNEKNYIETKVKLQKNINCELEIFQAGLYRESGSISFSNSGAFFRINEAVNPDTNDITDGIPVYAMDDLKLSIKGRPILKMDIEGSERAALEGAVGFIKRYKPYLAICVYHKGRDILELPEFIKEICEDYEFVIRGGMHMVCYGFPQRS
jgi:FkbM family methyltransferase